MSDATFTPDLAEPSGDAVPMRRVIAFLAMVFGMFMAILDIQIVSASLSEIQAGLGAGQDEIAWVQTSYLIAEVIMIPLSGILARILSTRVLFSISAAGFTLASALASTATTIDQMIIYRAIQGFIGGGMIPSVFAAAFTVFPRSKRPIVSPMIGLVATLAPTIGPTVGGYISHALSWHWLFLINIVPGIAVTLAAWTLIDFDKPERNLIKSFDWWGLLGMAAFLGSLEYVLEEGPANDWLSDASIAGFAALMTIGAILFFYRAFAAKLPVVDLRAFSDVNFAFGSVFSFVMGVGLYGLTYLYPLYLSTVRGYDSLMIGEAMFVSGLCMFLTAPVAGALSARMDLRLMLLIGFVGFGSGTWIMTGMTADWDFDEILLPQILRGVSLMLCMVPINNLALGTLPPERMKNASGLFNLTRNLGGAVGLAVINTILNNRDDMHYARLAESVNWANRSALDTLESLSRTFSTQGLPGDDAAVSQLTAIVQQQAWVMSFIDVFWFMTALFVGLALAAILMRKPENATAGGGH
ncbi:DHA2 family efflux MFS transporter permease subunit [Hoeflea sp. WL0058]|uniref:DHA2 family efflux MFS transporter permease subunit n=2 Tax=Flavimaribacter sediminis TaxID=2865987 RepID=A0AAE2ZJ01_9HYPH|nr:DHA2 family efflux MFS transporter permease subunit [Flavimaribacter sediminis]MBW8635607.1 DHA2 family efflux MFS transporter permease subunit [Flavimaribacter sediminis]